MPINNINELRQQYQDAQTRAENHSVSLPPTACLTAAIGDERLEFLLKHVKGVNRADTNVKTGEITIVCISHVSSVQLLHDALAAMTRDGFAAWIPSSSSDDFIERIRFSSWDIEFAISDELRAQERFTNAVAVCKATYEIPLTYQDRVFSVYSDDDDNSVFIIERREVSDDE